MYCPFGTKCFRWPILGRAARMIGEAIFRFIHQDLRLNNSPESTNAHNQLDSYSHKKRLAGIMCEKPCTLDIFGYIREINSTSTVHVRLIS